MKSYVAFHEGHSYWGSISACIAWAMLETRRIAAPVHIAVARPNQRTARVVCEVDEDEIRRLTSIVLVELRRLASKEPGHNDLRNHEGDVDA
jgi:hypothetical protein